MWIIRLYDTQSNSPNGCIEKPKNQENNKKPATSLAYQASLYFPIFDGLSNKLLTHFKRTG